MELVLPYPPSVNHYWRLWRGRMVLSKEGRAYRRRVEAILLAHGVEPLDGPVCVHIEAFAPDRRRRDLDNLLKAVGDALEHGGALKDDSQIVWLLIEKAAVPRPAIGGQIKVTIVPRHAAAEAQAHG